MNEYPDTCEYLFPLFYLSLFLYWFSCFEYIMCVLSTLLTIKLYSCIFFLNAVLLPIAVLKSCSLKGIIESKRGSIRQMVMLKCFSSKELLLLLSYNYLSFLRSLPEHYFSWKQTQLKVLGNLGHHSKNCKPGFGLCERSECFIWREQTIGP